MSGGSCTSMCRVDLSEALVPSLFCSSELASTFIGATPPSATIALTADGATGSILYSGSPPATAAEIRIDAEFLRRQRRESGEPALEFSIKIAAGIALAACIHAAAAVRR